MAKLKTLIIVLCLLFWPLSLILANIFNDYIKYILPSLLVALSNFLLHKKVGFYLFPLLAIPFIEPKLAVFPVTAFLVLFLWEKQIKYLVFLLTSFLILVFTWRSFWGQTIFQPDYEAQQEIVSRTYLYPDVLTARVFQNKIRVYINKFNNNFFALSDPNNYFFNFHPREILIDNQNLNKYPFWAIGFALFGFYYLKRNPQWKLILIFLSSALLSLSILKVFDRNDFILWVPMSLVIIHGINEFRVKRKLFTKIFYFVFLAFTIPQLVRIFVQ